MLGSFEHTFSNAQWENGEKKDIEDIGSASLVMYIHA